MSGRQPGGINRRFKNKPRGYNSHVKSLTTRAHTVPINYENPVVPRNGKNAKNEQVDEKNNSARPKVDENKRKNTIKKNENEMDDLQKNSDINIVSLVESPSLRESVGEMAKSNEELVITLRESMAEGENIFDELKFKHEYIEYRIGEKGRAMAIWSDGSEDMFEIAGDTMYQIANV